MEIWRDVTGFVGLYQVSNYGNVRSLHNRHNNNDKPFFLKQEIMRKGYYRVSLFKDGVSKRELTHRLVALAFIPNPHNLPYVNHKDENKTNNFVCLNKDGSINYEKSNLEWCTNDYNENYGTRNKRTGESRQKPVIVLDRLNKYSLVAEYPSLKIAGKAYGVCEEQIAYYCRTTRSPRKELLKRYKFEFKHKKDHFSRQMK